MGHYTLRTKDAEDAIIHKAQKRIGASSVSKAFMTAITAYEQHIDEIQQLRAALAQEKARSQALTDSIKHFQGSMTALFTLVGDE